MNVSDHAEENQAPGLGETAVRTGTIFASTLMANQALAFVSFVILARLAPPETFGSYAAAAILLGWTALLATGGMQAAVVQREGDVQAAASTALAINAVGGVLLGALAAAAGPIIGLFFESSEIGVAAFVLAGTIPIAALAIVPGALLQRRFSSKRIAVEPAATVAFGLTAAPLLAAGFGIWALVIGTYASAVVKTGLLWAFSRWRPTVSLVSRDLYRELSRYGRPVLAGEFLRESGRVGQTAVLGRVLGTAALAEFRYAWQLVAHATVPIAFGAAFALLPAFSRVRGDHERLHAGVLRAVEVLSLVIFPISLVFIPLGEPLARTMFGEPWRDAGPVMGALAGVGVAIVFESVASETAKAVGRTELLPRMQVLGVIVPLCLSLAVVDRGAVAVGLAVSVGALLVAAYGVVVMRRLVNLPIHVTLKRCAPPLAAAGVMVAVVWPLEQSVNAARGGPVGLLLLAIEAVVAAMVYLSILRLAFPRSAAELRSVAQTAARRLRRTG